MADVGSNTVCLIDVAAGTTSTVTVAGDYAPDYLDAVGRGAYFANLCSCCVLQRAGHWHDPGNKHRFHPFHDSAGSVAIACGHYRRRQRNPHPPGPFGSMPDSAVVADAPLAVRGRVDYDAFTGGTGRRRPGPHQGRRARDRPPKRSAARQALSAGVTVGSRCSYYVVLCDA